MDIAGKKVRHKTFGRGTVISAGPKGMPVDFENGTRMTFQYPGAFGCYLQAEDKAVQAAMEAEIAENEKAEEAEKQRAAEEKRAEALRLAKEAEQAERLRLHPRRNIAFKCNYCDGGSGKDRIGFAGICSDAVIRSNVEKRKYASCTDKSSHCRQYLAGKISYAALTDLWSGDKEGGGIACYECRMLKDWKASAGWAKTGEPDKILNAQKNSLCVLTTRDPQDGGEKDRYIFGVFIIDEVFEGDGEKEGYVRAAADSPYKIALSPEEAHGLKFWDYYANRVRPEKTSWAQGLFRYMDSGSDPRSVDDSAVRLLEKIAGMKKGTPQEPAAQALLERFLEITKTKETAENAQQ